MQIFQSNTIPPFLWNCLDQVLAFNVLLVHIRGRANSAAVVLACMQTDPSAVLELTLSDRFRIKGFIKISLQKHPTLIYRRPSPSKTCSQM